MITIVSGTNRKKSRTLKVARFYQKLLEERNQETKLIDLSELPEDFMFSALYENRGTNDRFQPIQNHFSQHTKFLFITPEYNGSFPGALKTFIDALQFPGTLKGKKCAIVGLSTGVQGGILAMSHLTDIFNYLGMHVLASKPKLSGIDKKMDGDEIVDERYVRYLNEQADALISF